MRNYQPNPELMLDSKSHSEDWRICRFTMTFPAFSEQQPAKVAIQLSIFPTATLTFVILVQEKKSQCT